MSKETMTALECQWCGFRIQFVEYHLPHCIGRKMESKNVLGSSALGSKLSMPARRDERLSAGKTGKGRR